MTIKIKRLHVAAMVGFICLVSGYMLFSLFLQILRDNGWYGILIIVTFIASLTWMINYFLNFKFEVDLAKGVARQVAEELFKKNPELFRGISVQKVTNDIEARLMSKIDEKKYILWGKKA